jgi:hypothetical protein
MNTADYFTYVNAMFLFCIFTCGLLVWAVIRGYILKGKLTKEQDSHLKATNTNTLLNKALSAKNAGLQANEHKLRDAEKEIRDLQAKLDHAEADRIELRAERATLENQLAAAKRIRNANGVFVRKDGTYTPKVKPRPTVGDEVVELTGIALPVTAQDVAKALVPKPHTLRYGMTVKNPTEKEAKEIFEAARVAGIESISSAGNVSLRYPDIWYCEGAGYNNGVCDCTMDGHGKGVVTSSEFIARIKGEVG